MRILCLDITKTCKFKWVLQPRVFMFTQYPKTCGGAFCPSFLLPLFKINLNAIGQGYSHGVLNFLQQRIYHFSLATQRCLILILAKNFKPISFPSGVFLCLPQKKSSSGYIVCIFPYFPTHSNLFRPRTVNRFHISREKNSLEMQTFHTKM